MNYGQGDTATFLTSCKLTVFGFSFQSCRRREFGIAPADVSLEIITNHIFDFVTSR